jgi:ubiquinone/menaquinone biosynthesis C-methylase UbiE
LLLLSRGLPCLLMLAVALALPQPAAAQLASKPAQEWIKTLDSSNRVERLKIDETLTALKIRPGDVIADIGAGSGLYSLPLAKAASPGGLVYAIDIEQGLLDHIAMRAKELQVTNIQMVLGKFTDPNLPATKVDLAFINDVLHHIEDRAGYLKSLARYVKPSGRIVIIDFYPELGPHQNDPSLQVTKDQTASWMAAIDFKPVQQLSLFKDKWFVVYSR